MAEDSDGESAPFYCTRAFRLDSEDLPPFEMTDDGKAIIHSMEVFCRVDLNMNDDSKPVRFCGMRKSLSGRGAVSNHVKTHNVDGMPVKIAPTSSGVMSSDVKSHNVVPPSRITILQYQLIPFA